MLCFVSPRFYPIIGGVEIYLQNIAEYCSSFMKVNVISSNLRNAPKYPFEKYFFVKKRYDILANNIEIIRTKTTNNIILKTLFFSNQYLNKKIEMHLDKKINPYLYFKIKNKKKINDNTSNIITNRLIYQRCFTNPNFVKIYHTLKKIHRTHKIDIIHSSPIYLTANIYAYRFSKKNQIPFICTPLFHINPYADYIFYPSYQHILKNSNATIACTKVEKNFYQKFGIKKKNIHVIPPGIEPKEYKNTNVENFRKKYNIPMEAPLLLFMGRKTYEKGILNSILAVKYLIKKFKDIRLLIAGPSTKEYILFLEKLPSELKSHIINLDIIDKDTKSNALASCDIFLLPSLDDAFGIVYLEAWLFKKPVIGATGGNVEGLIDNNINGFLVPFNDIKGLALKIEELLNSFKKREEFGKNGYDKLNNNYLLEITNKMILNLYNKFI